MLNWITCYLSGRHDYHVQCEPGSIFLACRNCGRRSSGWALHAQPTTQAQVPVRASAVSRVPVQVSRHAA